MNTWLYANWQFGILDGWWWFSAEQHLVDGRKNHVDDGVHESGMEESWIQSLRCSVILAKKMGARISKMFLYRPDSSAPAAAYLLGISSTIIRSSWAFVLSPVTREENEASSESFHEDETRTEAWLNYFWTHYKSMSGIAIILAHPKKKRRQTRVDSCAITFWIMHWSSNLRERGEFEYSILHFKTR